MSLISKDDVIEQMRYEVETAANQEHKFAYERAAHIIAAIPPVEAEPVRYGIWNERGNNLGRKCSECDYPIRYKNAIPDSASFYCRCPKCGAKMQGGEPNEAHGI